MKDGQTYPANRPEARTPVEARTYALAETTREQMQRDGYRVEGVNIEDNASAGFADSCDEYAGYAFCAWRDGRQFYVTVEDVTPASES